MPALQLLILWLLWTGIVFLAPSSVYWRDSGEFIVQAFALDIAHPAGYPTYGMISNLFALLPFGPIPWRVVLLSGAATIALVYCIHKLIQRMAAKGELSPTLLSCATIAAVLLCFSVLPISIKQIWSAEVYMLNALLLLGIGLLCIIATQTSDFRPLACASFLGGIAIGNHISGVLSAILLVVAIIIANPKSRRLFIPLCTLFIFGLSIYLYLPLRAAHSLPLNTGAPNSFERTWNVISDARDRHLRHDHSQNAGESSLAGFEKLVPNPLKNWRSDLTVIKVIPPLLFLGISFVAIIICLIKRSKETAVLSAIGLGNYAFFSGWDGDTWVPAIAILSIFWIVTLVLAMQLPALKRIATIGLGVAIATLAVLFPTRETFAQLVFLKSYTTPAETAKAWLSASDAPVMISEHSWFLIRYLADIEGVYDEKTILYQPSILFPAYFAPLRLSLGNGEVFDTLNDVQANMTERASPAFGTLGRLIERVSSRSVLAVEPSAPLNTVISSIMHFNKRGMPEVTRGTYADEGNIDGKVLAQPFLNLARTSQTAPSFIQTDARNYLENVLNSYIDLLRKQHNEKFAIGILQAVCRPLDNTFCSLVSLNHLGLVLIDANHHYDAARLYHSLMKRHPAESQILKRNLDIALAALAPAEQERFFKSVQTPVAP